MDLDRVLLALSASIVGLLAGGIFCRWLYRGAWESDQEAWERKFRGPE